MSTFGNAMMPDWIKKMFLMKLCFVIASFSVFVQVIPNSSADLAGIHINDVIIQCGEKPIQSFLEVYYLIM